MSAHFRKKKTFFENLANELNSGKSFRLSGHNKGKSNIFSARNLAIATTSSAVSGGVIYGLALLATSIAQPEIACTGDEPVVVHLSEISDSLTPTQTGSYKDISKDLIDNLAPCVRFIIAEATGEGKNSIKITFDAIAPASGRSVSRATKNPESIEKKRQEEFIVPATHAVSATLLPADKAYSYVCESIVSAALIPHGSRKMIIHSFTDLLYHTPASSFYGKRFHGFSAQCSVPIPGNITVNFHVISRRGNVAKLQNEKTERRYTHLLSAHGASILFNYF